MLPDNELQKFPMFVPDQVLTSQSLNELFDYLDEEGRMTRTNLIGIGIVCGMEVKNGIDGNGQFIAITKGTGVTSEGYLVTTPDKFVLDTSQTKYHKFKNYDAARCRYYEPFVNLTTKKQRFPIWELKGNSEIIGTSPLNTIPDGLGDKVVMLFAELLENNNKNCDPGSCDDKGINVEVSFVPLLIRRSDALALMAAGDSGISGVSFNNLDDLVMPRWNVPNTQPVTSDDIIKAYRNILTTGFIQNIEDKLTAAHKMFKPLVAYEYPNNPFLQFAEKFAFLANASLTSGQTVHIQYYYDFFSDIIQAYDEFCKAGKDLSGVCCPDETLFPRHLLLGEAVPLADNAPSAVRNYFTYSPLFECKNLIYTLRVLFRRMDLMLASFETPTSVVSGDDASDDKNIKATPSQLGNVPLSVKAIPYYYKVNKAVSSLQKFWNVEKKLRNKTDQNLSYNAIEYATKQFVLTPLVYDLEPNNFLRIEGVVGKNITGVLPTVQKRIDENRLPVQVLALKTGEPIVDGFDPKGMGCNTQDLEISFDIVRREWEAIVGKTVEYLHDNQPAAKAIIDSGHTNRMKNFIDDIQKSKDFIENTREELPAFAEVYEDFIPVFEKIETIAQQIRLDIMDMIKDVNNKNLDRILAEDIIDHMDEVVLSCRKGAFRAVYQEYMRRLEDIYEKMYFSGFAAKNPGLQHKAGVPVGGTYVLVYHSKPVVPGLKLTKKMKESIKKGPFIFQGIVFDSKNNPVQGAVIREKNAPKKVISANGKFTLALSQLPTIISVTAKGFHTYEEIILAPDKKKHIHLKTEKIASSGVGSLTNGTVIADFYLPYICCSDCAPIQFIIQEPPPNRPPVARAGDDISIVLPDNKVTLNAKDSSDPDENIVSYTWAYKSGPAQFLIDDPADIITDVNGLVEGQYVFAITVTDADGATSTDDVKITVLPAENQPPVVDAGIEKSVVLPNNVTLVGSAADPDGTIATTKWTKKSGTTGSNILSDATLTTDVSFTTPGNYVFTLTATDDKGLSRSDDVIVTVTEAPNQLPIARASVNFPVITLPTSAVILDSAGSQDPEGGALTFQWAKSPAHAPGAFANPTGASTEVTGLAEGNYTFTLTVKDDKKAIATSQVNVTVNRAPVAKNCGKLQSTISLFDKLESADPANFNEFTDRFKDYQDVQDYFKAMGVDAGVDADQQIGFFETFKLDFPSGTLFSNQLIEKWLRGLVVILKNPNFQRIHKLALAMYRVLVSLSLYIACVQRNDVDDAGMPMISVFDFMIASLGAFTAAQIASMPTDVQTIFKQMKKLFEAANTNLVDSEEISNKGDYGKRLSELIEILKKRGV